MIKLRIYRSLVHLAVVVPSYRQGMVKGACEASQFPVLARALSASQEIASDDKNARRYDLYRPHSQQWVLQQVVPYYQKTHWVCSFLAVSKAVFFG